MRAGITLCFFTEEITGPWKNFRDGVDVQLVGVERMASLFKVSHQLSII